MKTVSLKIGGMSCSACSSSLERFLNKQPGISSASVNLLLNTADVVYDDSVLTLADVEAFVPKIGFECLGLVKDSALPKPLTADKKTLVILGVLAGLLFCLSMFGSKLVTVQTHFLLYSLVLVFLAAVAAIISFPLLKRGFLSLARFVPSMESLVALGWLASLGYSLYLFFYYLLFGGSFPNYYFDASAMVLFFVHLGYYFETKHKGKTLNVVYSLAMLTPEQTIRVGADGSETEIGIADAQVGDLLLCKPGQRFAADGVVVSGSSYVDESFLSGESVPLLKQKGSKVMAGAVNTNGAITYKVQQVGRNSSISSVVRMVTQAANSRSAYQRFSDVASFYFVFVVLAFAIISFLYWLVWASAGLNVALVAFVNVLVVACPCALGISAPMAILAATNKAASFGVVIRNTAKLEVLPKVDIACLDKTGTLTMGQMYVNFSAYTNGFSQKDVLPRLAAVEKQSGHPIGNAIVGYAASLNIELPSPSSVEFITGKGFSAGVDSLKLLAGNKDWMDENGVLLSDGVPSQHGSDSMVFCAINGVLSAVYGVNDKVNPSSSDFIGSLKSENIEPCLISGDNEASVTSVAAEVGISQFKAKASPIDKARFVEASHKEGHAVLMFGDGVNDAPALVQSDVAVSISSGTEIATSCADFVLVSCNLANVISLLHLAKSTCSIIKQNLFWAFFYNVCMLPIAAGFFSPFGISLSPQFSAFAMVLSSLFIMGNSSRIKWMDFK